MRKVFALGFMVVACGGTSSSTTLSNEGVQTFPDQGQDHFTRDELSALLAGDDTIFTYNSDPPTSGTHANAWAPCGVYRQVIPKPFQVHSLEHGAVIIQYRPDLPEQERNEVEDLVRELATHAISAPGENVSGDLVMTAWTHMQIVDEFDIDAVRDFWADFARTGPERTSCAFEVDEATGAVVDFAALAAV